MNSTEAAEAIVDAITHCINNVVEISETTDVPINAHGAIHVIIKTLVGMHDIAQYMNEHQN